MKKVKEQISRKFYERLPQKEYFRPDDFSNSDFPDFLTERIQLAVREKITEKTELPAEWLDTEAEEVQQARKHFLDAVFNQARLPSDAARSVIEKSVDEIVSILVQPRKNIPEVIFLDEETVSAKTLDERVRKITVYQHFAQVLSSYVHRKNRSELTKDQCKKIVANVDEKLTENYSPQQWAQLLEPLITLSNDKVKSDLFRLFFEDKKMSQAARAFELTDETINRAEFIEILSGDNADDIETEKKAAFSPPPPVTGDDMADVKRQTADARRETPDVKPADAEALDESTNEPQKTGREPEKNSTVNTAFSADKKGSEESTSLNEIFASRQVKKSDYAKASTGEQETGDRRQETGASCSDENNEKTIWQRFAESDEKASNTENAKQVKSEQSGCRKKQLKQQLKDKRQYFIEELFNGSEAEYQKSISKIVGKNSWNQAVQTIQNDIFEKNDVNIYSPTAVDFTDRLQDYFTQEK